MKVGDLLYYRPASDDRFNEGCLGIVIAECHEHDELKMKTLWFDDMQITNEPMPDSPFYNEASVGVLSEGR
jgi:hypothetical protein